MKNFKKIALGLIVGAMAIGFSAFTKHTQLAGAYYSAADQSWISVGAQAPNQDSGNYTAIGSSGYTCSGAAVGCTYDLVDGKYVFTTEGENSLN